MAKILYANGGEKIVKGENPNGELTLEQMQKAVGGYIEIVPMDNPLYEGKTMLCNEEGKLVGLPTNIIATLIANIPDVIVGDVLLCDEGEFS